MSPLEIAIVFCVQYCNVFLLGFQQKNVQASRYVAAFFTSWCISVASFTFVKFAVHGDPLLFLLASCIGGGLGICSSIYVHDRWFPKKPAK